MKRSKTSVFDSSGEEFIVMGFTKGLEGYVNGFRLKGAKGQGEKEIPLSEYKFYKQRRK